MKRVFYLVLLVLVLASCEETGDLTATKPPGTVAETATPIFEGVFEPTQGISVTGNVKIYLEGGSYKLDFENLAISDGPDLKVYLSTAPFPQGFVNLGNFNVNNVYTIPSGVAVEHYSHVLIHCQQYNHLFAYAALQAIP